MSAEHLEVRYHGAPVGFLERAAGRITFTYSDTWRSRRDATPLSVGMPVQLREHPARVVEPFLWGLLPDNDAVLRRWGREFQVPTSHPFGLLAAVGEDLPGAMQIVRPERVAQLVSDEANVEWLTDDDVAALLRTDAFADVCRDPAIAELCSDLPGRLVDAVAARARRCAQQLRTRLSG
ncbi:type II toxin-antitoxin system HipA family toxin [Planosporangium thailandense]|uniref:Type II toxin-antitoxin system HipA family toxin n=1 Tax=Planosporangium thailandense TaxID=765197 RepID=A0ABX0XUF5_9ACTN|nr:type II toxin-antitoxin system HipA family toxin [Planosporangium thailandense]